MVKTVRQEDEYFDVRPSRGETFYHLTPTENVPSILKYGLRPRKFGKGITVNKEGRSKPAIYLCKDSWELGCLTEILVYAHPKKTFSVLKVKVPKGTKLYTYDDDLGVVAEFSTIHKAIPPKDIKLVGTIQAGSTSHRITSKGLPLKKFPQGAYAQRSEAQASFWDEKSGEIYSPMPYIEVKGLD